MTHIIPIAGFARRLRNDRSGLALMEFAFSLPILLTMILGGAEITNYVVVRMRVSQLALQIADNAARMGAGTMLEKKQVKETDIHDVFAGANLQSGALQLRTRGRVILSDLEPQANPNTNNTYRIRWQRCYGAQARASDPRVGGVRQNIAGGIGPAGHLTIAQDNNATMFVEVYYRYQPLVLGPFAPNMGTEIVEFASMSVRDRRDLTGGSNGVYPVAGVTAATCS